MRRAAVAGSFYPADAGRLRAEVDRLLASAPAPSGGPPPKALVVPHAGYLYSGPIAAVAYAQLLPLAGRVRRVVLLGPAHFTGFDGLALPDADALETPLGVVPVDMDAVAALERFPRVAHDASAHAREHSLEVQLPFLQRVLGEFTLVPLAVGWTEPADVAEVIDALWGGDETVVLASSDLSHELAYDDAKRMDAATARRILALGPVPLPAGSACGAGPVSGLLVVARRRGMTARQLDLRNSGDTAGPRDRVVGYGAFAFQ